MEDKRETLVRNTEEIAAATAGAAEEKPARTVVVPADSAKATVIAGSAAEDASAGAKPDEKTEAVTEAAPEATKIVEAGSEAEPEATRIVEAGAKGKPAAAEQGRSADDKTEAVEKGAIEGEAKEYGLPEDHHEIGELQERIEKRKKEKKKKQRHFRTWVYVTACTLMLLIFGFFFSISGFFTVDSIEVEGNEHYTTEEIINIAHAVPGRNLLYNTNEAEMVAYLEQNPYIKSAEVKRKLPSTILLVVKERTEKMAFKYDDDYLIMDGEGILLKKTRNVPQTTLVEGLIVNKIKLGEKIGTEQRQSTEQTIEIISHMSNADLYFVKLDVSDMKKVKAYIYDNLVVTTDYDTLIAKMDNGHLHRLVRELFKDGIKRGTITFDENGDAHFMPII